MEWAVTLKNRGTRVRRVRELGLDPRSIHFLAEWSGRQGRVGRLRAGESGPLDVPAQDLGPGEELVAKWRFPAVVAGELEVTAKYDGYADPGGLYHDTVSSSTVPVRVQGEGELQAVLRLAARGEVRLRLYPEDAYNTVTNFVALAQAGFYKGLVFHRVIKGFMIQGGCPEGTGRGGPGWWVPGEFNPRKHEAGSLAMARSNHPHSAGSQFYLCLEPQPGLDGRYTVFGQVVSGLDLVRAVGEVPTDASDRPREDVIIESLEIIEVKP
ncbi:MAG: peptidylprolyl isomerase [Planctomycetes bacterium]|nr:peptidylprolyl isomerase [Planctomycetota bacterium]